MVTVDVVAVLVEVGAECWRVGPKSGDSSGIMGMVGDGMTTTKAKQRGSEGLMAR